MIEPVRLDNCPDCGDDLDLEYVAQPALLRHGGYGATRATTTLHCRCGWALTVAIDETRPPVDNDPDHSQIKGSDRADGPGVLPLPRGSRAAYPPGQGPADHPVDPLPHVDNRKD